MRKRLITIFTILCGFAHAQEFSGRVSGIVDTNTLEIINKNKEVIKVKFKEIEVPLSGQMYDTEAKTYLEKLLLKKKVKVDLRGKDWLGNKLADINLGNKNVQKMLLTSGYAWVKERGDKKLVPIQETAKSQKIGLWQEADPTPPWVYRRQRTMMVAKTSN